MSAAATSWMDFTAAAAIRHYKRLLKGLEMMKRLKKISIILCILVLEMSLCRPAFASSVSGSYRPSGTSESVKEYTDKETIKKVQKALNDAGYDCGSVDGIKGPKTTQRIKEAQKMLRMPEDGVISDDFLKKLPNLPEKKLTDEEILLKYINLSGELLGKKIGSDGSLESVPDFLYEPKPLYKHDLEVWVAYNEGKNKVNAVEIRMPDIEPFSSDILFKLIDIFGERSLSGTDNPYHTIGYGNVSVWDNVVGKYDLGYILRGRDGDYDDFYAVFTDLKNLVYSDSWSMISAPEPEPEPKPSVKDLMSKTIYCAAPNCHKPANKKITDKNGMVRYYCDMHYILFLNTPPEPATNTKRNVEKKDDE